MSDVIKINGYDIKDLKAVRTYDNVAAMKSDTKLKEGQHVKTKGYYNNGDGGHAEYIIVNDSTLIDDGSSIHELENGYKAKLIIKNDTLSLLQLGGKRNDNTFDNASVIYKGLNLLQDNNGGTLFMESGIWNISSSIVIDFDIYSTLLKGTVGTMVQNKGTILKYTGSNNLFQFNGRCNHFYIEDFGVVCDDNSFAEFNLTFHKSHIKNVSVQNAIGGVLLNTGTYAKLENFSFSSNNANTEYGIKIGSTATHYTTEFVYIDNCSIDFQNVGTGNCLEILKTEGGIWVTRNDFCNTLGSGVYIENLLSSSNYYNFDNNNISGCNIGYEIKATSGNVGGLFINNQRISLNGNSVDERYIKTSCSSSYSTDLHLSNIYLRRRNANVVPTYLYEFTTNSIAKESCISFDGGEKFNSPIYCASNLQYLYDFRNDYSITLQANAIDSTGDKKIPLSTYTTLITTNNLSKWQTVSVNTTNNLYFIKMTYENGIPYINVRVSEVPTGRVAFVVSKDFSEPRNSI